MKKTIFAVAALVAATVSAFAEEPIKVKDYQTVTNSDSKITGKTEYGYDAVGRTTSETHYSCNEGEYTSSTKTTYEYATDGRLAKSETDYWDGKDWVSSMKTELYVDNTANTRGEKTYSYDGTKSEWTILYQNDSTFNEKGNLISIISYSIPEGSTTLQQEYKYCYTYDEQGREKTEENFEYKSTTSQFEVYFKGEFTYNNDGSVTEEYSELMDEETSKWSDGKSIYKVDDKGREIYSEQYVKENDAWVLSSKEEASYDGDYESYSSYEWNAGTSDWTQTDGTKYELVKDGDGDVTKATCSYYSDSAWSVYSITQIYYKNLTGINNVHVDSTVGKGTRKVLQNGVVRIIKGSKVFSTSGQQLMR